jgi:hypothetical protein
MRPMRDARINAFADGRQFKHTIYADHVFKLGANGELRLI